MAAVVVHEGASGTRDIWALFGASGTIATESDKTLLPTDYLGSGVSLQAAQSYSKLSTWGDRETNASWRDMLPETTHHSNEISWAYHMRNTWNVASTGIVCYSQNGSGLTKDWVNGAGYLSLALGRLATELAALGQPYVFRGVCLFLAATDAEALYAPSYGTSLVTAATAIRATYPNASFIIQKPSSDLVNEGYTQGNVDLIRNAVDSYVLTDANSIGYSVDDYPFDGTGPHYLTTSIVPIGEIMAAACAKVLYLPRRGGVVYEP